MLNEYVVPGFKHGVSDFHTWDECLGRCVGKKASQIVVGSLIWDGLAMPKHSMAKT